MSAKHRKDVELAEEEQAGSQVPDRELVKEKRIKERVRKNSSVNFLMRRAVEGGESREQVCELAYQDCQDAEYFNNAQGRTITKEGLLRLLNAILRDIDHKRSGWWSKCDYEEIQADPSKNKMGVFKVYGYNR